MTELVWLNQMGGNSSGELPVPTVPHCITYARARSKYMLSTEILELLVFANNLDNHE